MQKPINGAMTKQPVAIGPYVNLNDAMEIMRSWGMRHLPVTEKEGQVVGLLSERDLWRYAALHPNSKATVRDAMVKAPFVVEPDDLLVDVLETMTEKKYGCAVVADSRGLCGIFTTTDALRILADLLRGPGGAPAKVLKISDYFARAL